MAGVGVCALVKEIFHPYAHTHTNDSSMKRTRAREKERSFYLDSCPLTTHTRGNFSVSYEICKFSFSVPLSPFPSFNHQLLAAAVSFDKQHKQKRKTHTCVYEQTYTHTRTNTRTFSFCYI